MGRTIVCCVLILVLSLLQTTCAPSSTQGPSAWLDQPLDGARLPLGPREITAHGSDLDGVTSLEFYVDGTLLVSAPVGGSVLEHATIGWNPSRPGVYTISARATDSQGNTGLESVAVVTVGEVEASPTPSPTLVPTEEIVTQETPSPGPPAATAMRATWTPRAPAATTIAPTRTPQPPTVTPQPPTATPQPPTATPQPPAIRAVIAYFQANPTTINEGGCSTLSWGVDYADAVYLDGEGVVGHDDRQVCPGTTTTYTLFAAAGGGDDQATAMVTVIQQPTPTHTPTEPVDNAKPTISDVSLSQSRLHTYPDNCGTGGCPCTLILSARVTDESGVVAVVATLQLAGSSQGSRIMNQSAPDVYAAELGPFTKPGELVITIVTQDWYANTAEQVLFPVTVWDSCVG
jgi:hypothetical protein